MRHAAARRLAEFCRDRIGGSVRTVTAYDAEGFEAVYVREDLRAEYTHERFVGLVDAARRVHEQVHPLTELDDTPVGNYEVSVHAFDNAVVLQFYCSETEGLLASFDRDVGRSLSDFVDACRGVIDGGAAEGV